MTHLGDISQSQERPAPVSLQVERTRRIQTIIIDQRGKRG
jgi:hypothetical protein